MTGGDGSGATPPGFRLGTAADVGRIGEAGLRAAAAVVEQVLGLSRQLTEVRFPTTARLGGPDGPDPDGSTTDRDDAVGGSGDRQRDLRTLRADAERLIELYGDWTRALVDGVAALAEGEPTTAADLLVLGPVAPGETVTGTLWLHTFEGPVAAPAPLHVTELVSHRRDLVAADAVAFDPPTLDISQAFASHEITVTASVPSTVPAGLYRAWVLAEGLPEIALALQLEVR